MWCVWIRNLQKLAKESWTQTSAVRTSTWIICNPETSFFFSLSIGVILIQEYIHIKTFENVNQL